MKTDKSHIEALLSCWEHLIEEDINIIHDKISNLPGGLNGRLKKKVGSVAVFNAEGRKRLQDIRQIIATAFPEMKDLIMSDPDFLLNGHHWKRGDYVELYFEHYKILIDKIRQKMVYV